MKGVPYLNPNSYCRFIDPKNLGEALIDGELATCLLDNGAQLNFITPAYAHKWGMDIMSLESLAQEIGRENSSNSRHRGYHGETRRIHYDERADPMC